MNPTLNLLQRSSATVLKSRLLLNRPRLFSASRAFAQNTVIMADRVHRITMFKMPNKEDQEKMQQQYTILGETQEKDGKPYILSMVVGPAEEDQRSQGYTLVSKTEFASLEDMKYYDESCKAHSALKAFIKQTACDGILTVYFKPTIIGGTDASS